MIGISTKFIVELEPGTWLARSEYRVCALISTHRDDIRAEYATKHGAQIALGLARKYRPFPDANVIQVEVTE